MSFLHWPINIVIRSYLHSGISYWNCNSVQFDYCYTCQSIKWIVQSTNGNSNPQPMVESVWHFYVNPPTLLVLNHDLISNTIYTAYLSSWLHHLNGLVQERHNSSALAMELRLSCTKPGICIFATSQINLGSSTNAVKYPTWVIKWSYVCQNMPFLTHSS